MHDDRRPTPTWPREVPIEGELARTWPHQTEVTVRGLHFVQEDSPDEIGQALANWIDGLVGDARG